MPDANRILVGATHECKELSFLLKMSLGELKDRSYVFASSLWDHSRVETITSGLLVQNQRGKYGRLPIIKGKHEKFIPALGFSTDLTEHPGACYLSCVLSNMILGQWIENYTLNKEADRWKK